MPAPLLRCCSHPGCPVLLAAGQRCDVHSRAVVAQPGRFADRRRGTRQARGYGAEWDALRPLILARDGGLCQVCFERGVMTPGCNTVDHRVPRFEGGTDDPSNLRAICTTCHAVKTAAEALRARGLASSDAAPVVRVGQLRLS